MSYAFLTDVVPGIAMSILFGQLNLMAFPLRKALGDDYTEEERASITEELVVTISSAEAAVDWAAVGGLAALIGGGGSGGNGSSSGGGNSNDILSVRQILPTLLILKVPSCKPFTRSLLRLAQYVPSSKILRCSGHRETQVKVKLSACAIASRGLDVLLDMLGKQPGVAVMFSYAFPGLDDKMVSLCVQFPALLALIRVIAKTPDCSIEQVFDFWA